MADEAEGEANVLVEEEAAATEEPGALGDDGDGATAAQDYCLESILVAGACGVKV